MRTARVLLGLTGLAALCWGAVLVAGVLLPLRVQSAGLVAWLLAGPLVHDLLVAPIAGAVGLALATVAGRAWHAPLVVGSVLTGVLALLAVPLLWRDFGAPPSPGLHDGDPWAGLGWSLLAVWLSVAAAGAARTVLHRAARHRASTT